MRDADVLASHHEIANVRRVQTTKRYFVRRPIARIPDPIFQPEIIIGLTRFKCAMDTEVSVVSHQRVLEVNVIDDVILRKDIIPLIALVLWKGTAEIVALPR